MNRVNSPQIFGDYTLLPSYSRFQHLGLTDERPSLAHRHIALWFYAKLTPLVLLHCQLTHAPWKWFFLQQPASLPALEGHLSPLLSWKRQREKVDWLEKNNRELRKLSGRGRGSLPSDSRSESSSSRNSCSRGRQSRAKRSARTPLVHDGDETLVYHTINTQIL